MISRSFERPERTARRASAATKRYKMRFIELGSADIVQVNAHDRVSGTHRVFVPFGPHGGGGRLLGCHCARDRSAVASNRPHGGAGAAALISLSVAASRVLLGVH